MSLHAILWALEHPGCPSASAKLVLITMANMIDADGCSWQSVETVARITCLNVKTVRASIDALERCGLIADTGGRKGRTQQVKVYRLGGGRSPKTDAFQPDPANDASGEPQEGSQVVARESLPKTGALKAPVFSGKGSRNRVADPVTGPLPPEEADASSRPQGGRARGSRIDPDWSSPAIADLPPQARRLAEQWPAGAYQAETEAFVNYWLGEGRAGATKLDWTRTWCNRIIQLGAKPLRDARAGVRFDENGSAPPADQVERCERTAAVYARMGRAEEAAAMRDQAARLRGSAQRTA